MRTKKKYTGSDLSLAAADAAKETGSRGTFIRRQGGVFPINRHWWLFLADSIVKLLARVKRVWYICGQPSVSDVRLMMLAKLAVNNLIGLLECDRQMVRPVTLKVLPFYGLFTARESTELVPSDTPGYSTLMVKPCHDLPPPFIKLIEAGQEWIWTSLPLVTLYWYPASCPFTLGNVDPSYLETKGQ